MYLPMEISSDEQEEMKIIEGLLDSGASRKFIDQNYVKTIGAKTKTLDKVIKVYNVDGTPNKQGMIRKYVELNLEVHGWKWLHWLLVTGLWKQKIILGFTWLKGENPLINWKKGTLRWRDSRNESKEIIYYTYVQNILKEPTLKKVWIKAQIPFIEEEDTKEYLNFTQHSLNKDKDELGWLISSTSEMNKTWINAKVNKSMEIQAEINENKEVNQ